MKKVTLIIGCLTAVILAVGSVDSNTTSKGNAANTITQTSKEEIKPIKIGDTIKSAKAEITIKKIEFSYNILPDDTSGFYTHYPADSGNVYIHIDTDVKNIQKQQLGADEIMTIIADYNEEYTYTSQAVPEDSSTGFTYANITAIDPLKTLGIRYLISAPQEVEESENSLKLIFNIDGEKYEYIMR